MSSSQAKRHTKRHVKRRSVTPIAEYRLVGTEPEGSVAAEQPDPFAKHTAAGLTELEWAAALEVADLKEPAMVADTAAEPVAGLGTAFALAVALAVVTADKLLAASTATLDQAAKLLAAAAALAVAAARSRGCLQSVVPVVAGTAAVLVVAA